MTIELHDAVNGDGLIDVQGEAFGAMELLNTAVKTTVPAQVETFIDFFQKRADADDLQIVETMEGITAAVESWQAGGTGGLSAQLQTVLEDLLLAVVAADAPQPEATLEYALQYIIDQMETDGDYVAANTITLGLTPGGSNTGDVAIVYSELRGDGRQQEHIYAETIQVSVSDVTGPTLRFQGAVAQTDLLANDWPLGSGADVSITATDPANSLLSNGDFEDETIDDTPDNWMVHIGTPGTTVKITDVEVQTVTISGTPTGGSYLLQWVDPNSDNRSTVPLAYNASGSAVQSALRAIPGLEAVTVATTGTSPNYTHTITFTGAKGDPSQLTSVSDLTGGTPNIAHATTTAASAGAYRSKALEFDSDGAELTALYHALTLTNEKVYFVHARIKRVGAAASGEVRLEIVDGIGGSVVQDGEANNASKTVTVSAISTSDHDSEWFSFRCPKDQAQPVYLRIRISTVIPNTASVFFDEIAVAEGTRLYAGGPYVAVFDGATVPGKDNTWDLTATNNRAGGIQEWYNRVFAMADLDLLLPTSGSSLIPPSWP
jgi:hypothetical protein